MGLLRFMLAAAVVLGHAPGWGGFTPQPISTGFLLPYHAVQAFFVISGFYMSLVYGGYGGRVLHFYLSRYTRLIASFWVVAITTLVLAFYNPDVPQVAEYFRNFSEATGLWAVIVAFPNIFILGMDTLWWVSKEFPQYWVVPQAWSLSTELWFYLLVPLLVPARTATLATICAVCFAARFTFPIDGHPFPYELPFFLVGVMAHRLYAAHLAGQSLPPRAGWAGLASVCVFVAFSRHLHLLPNPNRETFANGIAICIAMLVLLPLVHAFTKRWSYDRMIGELSYPVYLWHVAIGYFFEPAQQLWSGYFLLLMSVLASIPVVMLVDKPLERWRHRMLRRETAEREVQPSPAVAASRSGSAALGVAPVLH